jgi:hypothetical protein
MVSALVLRGAPNEPKLASAPSATPAAGFGGFGAQLVSGNVRPSAAAPAPAAPAAASEEAARIAVSLSPGEWARLAKDKPARLLPLATREKLPMEVLAMPTGEPPVEDGKRSMLTVYYVVNGKDMSSALGANRRMRVELPLEGSVDKYRVVPYGALYYDAQGTSWVYVAKAPLVFERQKVKVERVAGNLVALSEGPQPGTQVVSVGAALLFGAEIYGK